MKVSIITVTYNSSKTLTDTMEAVLRQSYDNIEYIVVDGASTDGTIDLIHQYEPRFKGRMRWISEPDCGIYDAMNKGIRMATGDIVGILNSDDYFTSDNVIESIVPYFADETLDAIYGDIHFIKDGQPEKIIRYYSSKLFRPFWLRFGFMPAHPSFYCRRRIYNEAGLYKTDYKIAADYEMMVRLFRVHHIKAKYIQMDIVTMRTGGASTHNVNSRLIGINEDIRSCRENGIYTNSIMICLEYLYKIFEFKW